MCCDISVDDIATKGQNNSPITAHLRFHLSSRRDNDELYYNCPVGTKHGYQLLSSSLGIQSVHHNNDNSFDCEVIPR